MPTRSPRRSSPRRPVVSPPNPYDPDYQSGVGVATMAGNGLVVAEWYIPA